MNRTMKWQNYPENGVELGWESEKTLKVCYHGLLEKSGAQEMYAHYGYGSKWKAPSYVKLTRTTTGFEGEIPVKESKEPVNICFKDGADNWDNNCGWNYQATTTNPTTPTKSTRTAATKKK